MPEVPPVMRTVLFSKVFIVGLNVLKIDFLAKAAHETETIIRQDIAGSNRYRPRASYLVRGWQSDPIHLCRKYLVNALVGNIPAGRNNAVPHESR
jgi:hypothetical protein